jgi:hypothetical protein
MSWLVLLVVGGLACAGVDDPAAGSQHLDAGAFQLDADPPGWCHVAPSVALLQPKQADVLILLDRSGSMGTAFGANTRYQAVTALLSDLVASYANHLRFGLQEMPGSGICGPQSNLGCCVSSPSIVTAPNNAQAMLATLGAAGTPDGNSPTALALNAAHTYFDGLDDGVENGYVLLATDGAPDCTVTGQLLNADTFDSQGTRIAGPCFDALKEVHDLVADGVDVIVLGVDSDLGDDLDGQVGCLDALGHAGGAEASPGSPAFYSVGDPRPLQLKLEQIFGGVTRASCSLSLPYATTTPNPAIFLDGQEIPPDATDPSGGESGNGWFLDATQSPPAVRITGAYCDQIESFDATQILARYECQPGPSSF